MKKGQFDFYFFVTVLALLGIGLIMVFSASTESARYASFTGGDAYYFIKRQAIWAVISVGGMLFFSKFNYRKLAKMAPLILGGTLLLLILVLVVGTDVNGGKRWIVLGPMQFQPSELAKIAVILFLSHSLAQNPKMLETFTKGLLPYLGVLGVVAVLLMLQPHFSATVLIMLVGVAILFVGGAKIGHLVALAVPAMVGAAALVVSSPYRWSRFTAYMDPFKDKLGDGWQIIQSLYAIGSGGLFGLGLGRSRQKFLYIPEPHNDFIFSIVCEELGFIGAILVITLFGILIWRGIKIAMEAPDTTGSLIATGITTLIAAEVIINIAVVTSSMPVTGMPLPFFSYGGTALLATMCCMGIMMNISSQSKKSAALSSQKGA